jgi:hypothetical protein
MNSTLIRVPRTHGLPPSTSGLDSIHISGDASAAIGRSVADRPKKTKAQLVAELKDEQIQSIASSGVPNGILRLMDKSHFARFHRFARSFRCGWVA